MSHYAERDRVLRALRFACPTRFHNPVAEPFTQLCSIGAITAVYLDSSGHSNEAEYVVSINRVTATCQLEIKAFQILVDNQHVFFRTGDLIVLRLLQIISFGAAIRNVIMYIIFPLLLFQIFVYDFIHIQRFVRNALIKIRHRLEAETLDKTHHYGFIIFYFPVLEFPFYRFLGESMLAGGHFFQCLADFGARFGAGYDIQPVLLGCLRIRRHDFHLVTAIQDLS